MSAIQKTKRVRDKTTRRLARRKSPEQMQADGQAPGLTSAAQQSAGEPVGRSAADWPPNTWWP